MRWLCALGILLSVVVGTWQRPASAQSAPAAGASSGSPSPVPMIPFGLLPSWHTPGPGQPAPTLPAPGVVSQKVTPRALFVIADGGDAPTRGRFVSEVARQLQTYYAISPQLQLIPEPTWAVTDYMNTCAKFAGVTAGALIVEVASMSNGAGNWFFQRASWTELSGELLFSSCTLDRSQGSGGSEASTAESTPNPLTPVNQLAWKKGEKKGEKTLVFSVFNTPAPKPTPTPYRIEWVTNVHDESGRLRNVSPLPVTGVLLALVSSAAAIFPSRTTIGENTIVYPTPYPWLPGSSNGYVSRSETTNQTVTNPQSESTIATGFLSSSLLYDTNVNSLQPSYDDTSMRAVRAIVAGFLKEVGCPLADPKITPDTYGISIHERTPTHNPPLCDSLVTPPTPQATLAP
jgi:hypothetical protein